MALLRADFALRDGTNGSDVRSSPVIFRTTTSGFSTASISMRQFDVGHPAYAGALFLLIVTTVFGGVCLIGGLVFTALQYVGKL